MRPSLFGKAADTTPDGQFYVTVGTVYEYESGDYSNGEYVTYGFLYQKINDVWTHVDLLQPSTQSADGSSNYAESISISPDGTVIAIGLDENGVDEDRKGSVYVFRKAGGVWSEETKLTDPNAVDKDEFGISVTCSNSTVVVGTMINKIFVYNYSGGSWSRTDEILGDVDQFGRGDDFGQQVALSGDGSTLIVSAKREDGVNDTDRDTGAIIVYSNSNGTFSEQHRVRIASLDRISLGTGAVDVDYTGSTIIVGYPKDSTVHTLGGAIYVFEKVSGGWAETQKITPSDLTYRGKLGDYVAISPDGKSIGGAAANDQTYHPDDLYGGAGAVYMFLKEGGTFVRKAKVFSPNPRPMGIFGYNVKALNGEEFIICDSSNDNFRVFKTVG